MAYTINPINCANTIDHKISSNIYKIYFSTITTVYDTSDWALDLQKKTEPMQSCEKLPQDHNIQSKLTPYKPMSKRLPPEVMS